MSGFKLNGQPNAIVRRPLPAPVTSHGLPFADHRSHDLRAMHLPGLLRAGLTVRQWTWFAKSRDPSHSRLDWPAWTTQRCNITFLHTSLFIYEAAFAGSCLHHRWYAAMAVKSKGEPDCRLAMSTYNLGSIDPAHRMHVPSSLARGLMR